MTAAISGNEIEIAHTFLSFDTAVSHQPAQRVACRLLRSRPFWRDLLESAQKYGIGGTQKVEGDASPRVTYENAPRREAFAAWAYIQWPWELSGVGTMELLHLCD
jgi:hypothetical protein